MYSNYTMFITLVTKKIIFIKTYLSFTTSKGYVEEILKHAGTVFEFITCVCDLSVQLLAVLQCVGELGGNSPLYCCHVPHLLVDGFGHILRGYHSLPLCFLSKTR